QPAKGIRGAAPRARGPRPGRERLSAGRVDRGRNKQPAGARRRAAARRAADAHCKLVPRHDRGEPGQHAVRDPLDLQADPLAHQAPLPGRARLGRLLADRRLLLFALHQPGHRDAAGAHADREPADAAPAARADAGGQAAAKPQQQADVRKGKVYGGAVAVCRGQPGADQPVPQRAVRGRRLLRQHGDGPVRGADQARHIAQHLAERAVQHARAAAPAPARPGPDARLAPVRAARRAGRRAGAGAAQSERDHGAGAVQPVGDAHPLGPVDAGGRQRADAARHHVRRDKVDPGPNHPQHAAPKVQPLQAREQRSSETGPAVCGRAG
ncbi:hypothetical protein H4R19_007348, partial [Coemansia spiralis]